LIVPDPSLRKRIFRRSGHRFAEQNMRQHKNYSRFRSRCCMIAIQVDRKRL